ncbi:serine hydrolase [Halanaerocella petrolearia]
MHRFKRKIGVGLFLVLLLLPTVVQAQAFDVKANSAVLMDAETGQILFSKEPNLELPPASITKLMTILLTMEAVDNGETSLSSKIEVTPLAESMGGSQVWLEAGDKLELEELLRAVIIPSANDAAVAIAEYIGGTEQNFVQMMNRKARELGLKHTSFINTTGLPVDNGGHYSSAHDIAVIARELITEHPQVLKWTDKRVDYINNGKLPLYTTNNLIGNYPGATGLKTGWTEEAGYCLAGTAKRGDRHLIGVVMGTDSEQARVDETSKLLDYGFRAFRKVKLINQGVEIEEVPVKKGTQLKVPVETASGLSAVVKKGTKEQVEQEVKIDHELEAPVEKGAKVGRLIFKQDDKALDSVKLVTVNKVEKAGLFTLLYRWLKDFVLGFFNK